MATPREWLEAIETAHIQCRCAWLRPEVHELRALAVEACAGVNVDYMESIASIVEHQGADLNTARRELAERFRRAADRLYAVYGYDLDAVPDAIPEWMTAEPEDADA